MKKALLTGINDYKGEDSDLRGCINDVRNLAKMFCDMSFDVHTLTNSEVTKKGFTEHVKDLLLSGVPGDEFVISYSGHGTQVPDFNGDEADGFDEALYLYDGPLIDDDFQRQLAYKPEGVYLTLIMDCCFSGTNTRSIQKKPRFLPYMNVGIDENGNLTRKRRKRNIFRSAGMDHIVITGCAEQQTSADAYLNGQYNGALTYYAVKSFTKGMTYSQWYKEIRRHLPSRYFDQIPQLEGRQDLFQRGAFGLPVTKQKKCFLKFW
jgi:hypothetical protein